jgi:hypothetical protein
VGILPSTCLVAVLVWRRLGLRRQLDDLC